MTDSRFKSEHYNEYHTYLARLGADNSQTRNILLRNLKRAIREELTEKQWQAVRMYYIEQHTMTEIAEELGVNISTVSRTVGRGRRRLQKCLRYGARELLSGQYD